VGLVDGVGSDLAIFGGTWQSGAGLAVTLSGDGVCLSAGFVVTP